MLRVNFHLLDEVLHQVVDLAAAVQVVGPAGGVHLVGELPMPGKEEIANVLRGYKGLGVETEILSLKDRGYSSELEKPPVISKESVTATLDLTGGNSEVMTTLEGPNGTAGEYLSK